MAEDRGDRGEPGSAGPDERSDPVVARFLAELERRLGIGIVIHEIDDGPPMRVRATLMLESRVTDVIVEGDTEAETWDRLAHAGIAFRNEDQANLRIFGGG